MPSATFITLNTLRVLSILSLALSIATCIIVNVKGFPNLGHSNTLFQFINRSIIALEALFLIFAEIGWPKRLYTWFPMLDDDHSWSFFGFLQIVMGSLILGYDSGINSEDFLGTSLFVFIVVPGWFIFVIGIIYLICGLCGGVALKHQRRFGSSGSRDEKSSPPRYSV